MKRAFYDLIAEICEVARDAVTVTVFVYESRKTICTDYGTKADDKVLDMYQVILDA